MSGDTSGRHNWGQVLLARGCGGWEAAQHPPAHRTSPAELHSPKLSGAAREKTCCYHEDPTQHYDSMVSP